MAKTILIVEDNELNAKLLCDVLQAEGYATTCVRTGEEGVAAAGAAPPDLVLMDIRLPGMSGLEATQALKADAALARIPVVAVTAYAMNGDESEIRAAGCDGFVSKPFSIEILLGVVGSFLD